MRRILGCFCLLAMGFVFFTTSVSGALKEKPSNVQKFAHVPGQIIVKFKKTPGAQLDQSLQNKTMSFNYANPLPSIDTLNKKHKVKRMAHIFKGLKQESLKSGISIRALIEEKRKLLKPNVESASINASQPVLDHIYKLELEDPKADILAVCKEYSRDPNVEYAEPNYLAQVCFKPNDPLYARQWAHQETRAEMGWDITRGSSDIIIAVVDTGVDYNHEDLVANIWKDAGGHPGKDFVDIDTQAYIDAGCTLLPGEDYTGLDDDPMDYFGHGTHCAGIAGAAGDNSLGVSGVCPNCRIMPVRAGFALIDPYGNETGVLEEDDIVNAIAYAVANGADIISMSFGGDNASQLEKDTIDAAYAAGVVLVAAAGNHNVDWVNYPAGFDHVIAVAATSQHGFQAMYTNYGSWVDLAAPGGDSMDVNAQFGIISTVPKIGTLSDPSGYRYLQGTSMACPYVAGTAGLILSKTPGLNPLQVEHLLRYGVNKPGWAGNYIGTGLVDVFKDLSVNAFSSPTADARLTAPASGDILFMNTTQNSVDISGLATGQSFSVQAAADLSYDTQWSTLFSGTKVGNGLLGVLNKNDLALNATWYLKLCVQDQIELSSRPIRVNLFNSNAGWPKHTWMWQLGSPGFFDLDQDGKKEVMATMFDGQLFVFRPDGSLYPNWPRATAGLVPGSPASADIDKDGYGEIVVAGWKGIEVFKYNGAIQSGTWPKAYYTYKNPVLADLDQDGDLEIVIPGSIDTATYRLTRIYAWHHDGRNVSGWPINLDNANDISTVAVADLNKDGSLEIVAGVIDQGQDPHNGAGKVCVWKSDGTLLTSPATQGFAAAQPVLGDLDNDGNLEIVAAAPDFIYAWRNDGRSLPNFPLTRMDAIGYGDTPPILVDLDNDKDLEIIFAQGMDYIDQTNRGILAAYHHSGAPVDGWPVYIPNGNGMIEPVAGDIDQDGKPEVIAKTLPGLWAWKNNGTVVTGFPKPLESAAGSNREPFPALDDPDQDGKVEILYADVFDQIWMFRTENTYNPTTMPWPMYGHDTRHTGCYVSALPVTYTISGSVTYNGAALANVVMAGLPGNPVTNSAGRYSVVVNYGWSGTVTPNLAGYIFVPVNRAYTKVTADQIGQDYTAKPADGVTELINGQTVTGLSGKRTQWLYYKIKVPAGAKNLVVKTWGGAGDADLYIKSGSKPTLYSYNCRSINSTNYETGTLYYPMKGYYYIGIYAYATFSGASLTVSYK